MSDCGEHLPPAERAERESSGNESRFSFPCSKKGSVHARRRQRLEEERQRQDASLTYQDGQDHFELVVSKKGSNGKTKAPRVDAPLEVSWSIRLLQILVILKS